MTNYSDNYFNPCFPVFFNTGEDKRRHWCMFDTIVIPSLHVALPTCKLCHNKLQRGPGIERDLSLSLKVC